MNVDASMNGAGKAVESSAIKDLIKDGPDPTLKDWSLKPGAGSAFEGFSTVELAMKRSPSELLKWIFAAKTHDPSVLQEHLRGAGRQGPVADVNIACETTDSNFHADYVSATVKKGGSVIKTIAGNQLNNGDSKSVSVSWADAFGSASSLTSSTAFSVELYVTEKASAESAAITFPFAGTHKVTPGDGKYDITALPSARMIGWAEGAA